MYNCNHIPNKNLYFSKSFTRISSIQGQKKVPTRAPAGPHSTSVEPPGGPFRTSWGPLGGLSSLGAPWLRHGFYPLSAALTKAPQGFHTCFRNIHSFVVFLFIKIPLFQLNSVPYHMASSPVKPRMKKVRKLIRHFHQSEDVQQILVAVVYCLSFQDIRWLLREIR